MGSQLDLQRRWYAENIPLQDQVVADVGANVGALSRFFWDQGRGTNRVVSIEPLRENVVAIQAQIDQTGASGWTIETCVASGEDGEATIRVGHDAQEGWNSVVSAGAVTDTRRVPARRLSSLVPSATVVKIDIEGHEYVVLDEALPRMKTVHAWAIEFHYVPERPLEDALSMLTGYGYKIFAAGRRPGDASGAWMSAPIPDSLTWSSIPVAKVRSDGSVFKMVHVLARRDT